MLLHILIALILPVLLHTQAFKDTECPSGYVFLNDNYCVKLFTDKRKFDDASRFCLADDGKLVSIYNAIDNRRLSQLSSDLTTLVWTGLYCGSPVSAKNCQWDDVDSAEYTGEYQNFAPGNPSVPEPVAMVPFGRNAGKWYSANGDQAMLPFFCQKPTVDDCPYSFGGYCYIPLNEGSDLPTARKTCQASCGDLLSIHSKNENDFVLSIAKSMETDNNYMLLGAQRKIWLDGTSWNYDNFGYFNTDIGDNIGMAITENAEVRIGEWQSLDQQAFLAFICKKKVGVMCGESTLAPTASPFIYLFIYLFNTYLIYSPNYPFSYSFSQVTCSYTIIAHQNYHPFIEFSEFMLDPNATISIYEYPENNRERIAVLTSERVPTGRITSRTTLLWVEFSRPGLDHSVDYEWKASYGYVANSVFN